MQLSGIVQGWTLHGTALTRGRGANVFCQSIWASLALSRCQAAFNSQAWFGRRECGACQDTAAKRSGWNVSCQRTTHPRTQITLIHSAESLPSMRHNYSPNSLPSTNLVRLAPTSYLQGRRNGTVKMSSIETFEEIFLRAPPTVTVPLYVYPSPGSWDPLHVAVAANPGLHFLSFLV
jgi:hypothetical protein